MRCASGECLPARADAKAKSPNALRAREPPPPCVRGARVIGFISAARAGRASGSRGAVDLGVVCASRAHGACVPACADAKV